MNFDHPFLQTNRAAFREGLNRLCMTRPSSDRRVAKALNDLGWTDDSPVFGGEPGHMLEVSIARGQCILALMQASTVSSVEVKTEAGAEFLQLFSNSLYVLPCLT